MARKKPAKKAKAKSAKKTASKAKKKAAPKKAARRAAKASKKAAKKTAQEGREEAGAKGRKARRAQSRQAGQETQRRGHRRESPGRGHGRRRHGVASRKKPNLDRPRKTVADIHGIPSSLDMGRGASAAKRGRAELKESLSKNTSASPALTAGDVDADWESAESVGDEAPGGDNPTPDQDVVDDIGRALGVEYEDDEELQGGAEIADRDRHRWELDPSSKDDFDEEN